MRLECDRNTEMADSIPPDKDRTQSFLIRLWQERPNQWRGTIRHVQSEAQRGFVRLDQAVAFIEQRFNLRLQQPIREASEAEPARFGWNILGQRRALIAWAATGLVVLLALAFVLTGPVSSRSLSGTAVGVPAEFDIGLAFLLGLVLGGLGMRIWFRFRR